jgi:hypothetical protein
MWRLVLPGYGSANELTSGLTQTLMFFGGESVVVNHPIG